MSGERGLSGSRWAPINTGRPAYHWSSSRSKKANTNSARTTIAETHVSSPLPTTAHHASAAATNGAATAAYPTSDAPPPPPPPPDMTPFRADASALRRIPTPWAELNRFIKIARRMRWKLPFLAHGYRAATDRASEEREEAEMMFKLDFFEYYSLLERALVHLMGVFGVKVTGALGAMAANGGQHGRGDSTPRASQQQQQQQQQSSHRFHANVLEALDDPRNPLHEVLGEEEVRYALARAKELRNRWKNADDDDHAAIITASNNSKPRASRPLEDYDLEQVLDTIFSGCEEAYGVADRYVADVRALAAASGDASEGDLRDDPTDEEAQWEFIVDAMDWTT